MKTRTKIILLAIPAVLISGVIAGAILLRSYPADAEKLTEAYKQEKIEIEGMTHAQFGSYGEQRGDGVSEISDEKAVERLVEVIGAEIWRSFLLNEIKRT